MDIIDAKMKEIEEAGGGGGGASTWSGITGKPFESIGSGLSVKDGVLSATGGGSGGSGINYSTEEQVIGTWIDGKPLYQKSLPVTGYSYGAESVISFNVPNIKRIVDYDLCAIRSDGKFTILPQMHTNFTDWGAAAYDFTTNSFAMYLGRGFNTLTLSDMIITMQYTKTTD